MPDGPVTSWTPNEAWLFAELAKRALVVSVDGGEPERVTCFDGDADGVRVRLETHAKDDAIRLVLHLDADHANVALAPVRVDGNGWRGGWALECLRTRPESVERWILKPGGEPARIEDARGAPLTLELRVARRAIVRHGETVPLVDYAFHRYTRQSSIVEVANEPLAFARPTSTEAAPWWEIDFGKAVFLGWLRVEMADAPPNARLTVQAFDYFAKSGSPPPYSMTRSFATQELTRDSDGHASVGMECEVIARLVRVSLEHADGTPLSLRVTACEALAGEVFAGSLVATMRRAFALHHDRPLFIVGDDEALSYGDIRRRALRFANGLALRLEPATRADGRVVLALLLRNAPEWLLSDLAAIERGYVLVPISPDEPDERLARIIDQARPDAIVCDAKDASRASAFGSTRGLRLVIVTGPKTELPENDVVRVAFDDLLRDDQPAATEQAPRDAADLYSVLFTSGSTGTPKGAVRSYETFHTMLESYGAVQSARHLSFQPLSHLSERMVLAWLVSCGATIAFSRGGAHLMGELRAFGPTQVSSVPRLFDVLHAGYKRRLRELAASSRETPLAVHEAHALAEARAAFGPHLRGVSVGSAPVSPEVLAFMRRCFADLWVNEGYGITEVGTIALDNKIAVGVDVKLVPRVAEEAPDRGEIWVRTKHMISGYLGEDGTIVSAVDDDGYFATGDLGERAADGSVRVVGRLRNAVKLAQGEFVSAERIEAALATAPGVDRIYIHAEGGAPGVSALLFPSADSATMEPEAITSVLRAHGQRAGLAAWELPRGALVELDPPSLENGLLTPSGKLARGTIARRFAEQLSKLAADTPPLPIETDSHLYDDLDLTGQLVRIAAGVLGRPVDARSPLSSAGVDSLVAAEMLAAIGGHLGREVPLALWFEVGTLGELATRLVQFAAPTKTHANEALAAADRARVVDFGGERAPADVPARTILLTGATGLLGAHLVEALVARTTLSITCLVRAKDDDAALERLTAVLRGLDIPPPSRERVRVRAADLAQPRVGLDDVVYDALADEVDVILHSAAQVSWLASYEKLRGPNVHGTLALLELAAARKTKPFHFVSTISTAPLGGDEASILPFAASIAGSPYGLSKWIAEEHVRTAGTSGLPVAIYRPAMIAAHSRRGHGNPDDFLHRYMVGTSELGLYLDLDDARLDMTPVDFVAEAIVALLVAEPLGGATHHLVNVDQSLSYAAVGRAMRKAGVVLAPATYNELRRALSRERSSRLSALASYFPESGFTMAMGPWPCARTLDTLKALGIERPPVDDAMIARIVESLARRGHLHMMKR
jgi:fatty acid CoA ligase FadD9